MLILLQTKIKYKQFFLNLDLLFILHAVFSQRDARKRKARKRPFYMCLLPLALLGIIRVITVLIFGGLFGIIINNDAQP